MTIEEEVLVALEQSLMIMKMERSLSKSNCWDEIIGVAEHAISRARTGAPTTAETTTLTEDELDSQ